MGERTCAVDDCDRAAGYRVWCRRHYASWLKYGDALAVDGHLSSLPGERWLPVVGWESLYKVSSLGRVFTLPRSRVRGSLRNTWIDSHTGYVRVNLCYGGIKVYRAVHALVAEAFIGPRPDGQEVRHLDGDRQHCTLDNLAYGTRSENGRDRVGHGNHFNANKTHCKHGHEFTPENTFDNHGCRGCRACRNRNSRECKLRKRMEAA